MEEEHIQHFSEQAGDSWAALRKFTAARIALGRTGISEPLAHSLQFKLAHAYARDAVFSEINIDELTRDINNQFDIPVYSLQSQAGNRQEYLQRPDLGRKLSLQSVENLKKNVGNAPDIAIILADGLSATAINQHALPVLQLLVPNLRQLNCSLAPITLVEQGRVAISDEIGYLFKTKLALILIGERPGLSSPDSLGAYFTYNPQPGLTDESRNCLSNIRPAGLTYQEAANKLTYLLQEALRLKLSGVLLKDTTNLLS
ncbi:ethanolamine ammonia-lyase subunit EutC [Adhaeribacter swui]|uniref:Ethanolamine ammonia-lyase small subunit n=1 Tax=Adhaeribacter swui TaxID=2086471 RepID=A0A7G7GDP9_9BACT|nr:ethanolamine ammonia-lyase subunit EutC [Adhaeribacter swui]QNF35283.1 ethanolamine ammonia-lyase subunit EutC [Adhaeribacter swui]